MEKRENYSLMEVFKMMRDKYSDLDHGLLKQEIFSRINELIGRVDTFEYSSDGKVFVGINDAARRHDLFMRRDQLRTIINRGAGREVVSEIIFR